LKRSLTCFASSRSSCSSASRTLPCSSRSVTQRDSADQPWPMSAADSAWPNWPGGRRQAEVPVDGQNDVLAAGGQILPDPTRAVCGRSGRRSVLAVPAVSKTALNRCNRHRVAAIGANWLESARDDGE
jgi:hypothetical protein